MRFHFALIPVFGVQRRHRWRRTFKERLRRNVPRLPRAASPIVLDGRLDEAAWQAAPVAREFIQNEPREGEPATFDTEVRVIYDDEAIYFGVVAADPDPSRIIVADLKKDYAVDGSDAFVILLDTFHDGRNGYQFATNPAGAKWDAQLANEGRDFNVNWDGIWAVEARIDETGWWQKS